MSKKSAAFAALALLLLARPALPLDWGAEDSERERIRKGPLKIFADQTVSRDKGKMIEASGDVKATYDLENGDRIESRSEFARYDQKGLTGELTGSPRAVWKRKDPQFSQTHLTADKIVIKVEDEELLAEGRVFVSQASSTLKAESVTFSNVNKQLLAEGGTPEFDVVQDDQHTKIRAQKITAFTDTRQINFSGKVSGVVELRKLPQ